MTGKANENIQPFSLSDASEGLKEALEEAGYDLTNDPNEPNLLQARRDSASSTAVLIIDSGGQMRYTLTRKIGPEQARLHKAANNRVFAVTRESSETLTVSYEFSQADALDFANFLRELEKI